MGPDDLGFVSFNSESAPTPMTRQCGKRFTYCRYHRGQDCNLECLTYSLCPIQA